MRLWKLSIQWLSGIHCDGFAQKLQTAQKVKSLHKKAGGMKISRGSLALPCQNPQDFRSQSYLIRRWSSC